MEPLYHQSGQVHGWINGSAGRIVNLLGEHVAFVGRMVSTTGAVSILDGGSSSPYAHPRRRGRGVPARGRQLSAYQANSQNCAEVHDCPNNLNAAGTRTGSNQSRLAVGMAQLTPF
jgi:hypothetical protein